MTHTSKCPNCGLALAPDAAEGLCPKCLLEGGLEHSAAETEKSRRRYRLRKVGPITFQIQWT